jgi:hypothetical protein
MTVSICDNCGADSNNNSKFVLVPDPGFFIANGQWAVMTKDGLTFCSKECLLYFINKYFSKKEEIKMKTFVFIQEKITKLYWCNSSTLEEAIEMFLTEWNEQYFLKYKYIISKSSNKYVMIYSPERKSSLCFSIILLDEETPLIDFGQGS